MPLPLLALALPAVAKSLYGAWQMNQHAERVDTVTPAEKEALAMQRQAAASAQLPGLGMLQNRLAQTQAATVQNARLGAGSSSDFLAAGAAADATRQRAEQQLGMQGVQYQDRSRAALNQGLMQLAAHQQADTDAANKANAAFKGSGITNLFGGLTDGASVGAYAASGGLDKTAATPAGKSPYVSPYDQMYSPGLGGDGMGPGAYSSYGTYGTDDNRPNMGFRLRNMFRTPVH